MYISHLEKTNYIFNKYDYTLFRGDSGLFSFISDLTFRIFFYTKL
ncbi:hypothetical protein M116_1599 [Bacteroides fragilis str. 3719 A10]|nr:hypothetical protein M116_1599 [Bacteroides fragilis str. 3719 A10]